ncbi:tetratricopeptide repeat protein [Prevotella corporis]|uniref:tetratricopeptide repeat protein n=1 Tax=Prevotella corporis TaxID=28128 RepID=UPI0023EFF2CC|nr:tetratricopeptide repeat protein [Prevotella corporis]
MLFVFALTANAIPKDALMRYNYFFLEAIRQQEMGNMAAAFDLLNHAKDINPDAPEVYYKLAGYYVYMKNNEQARINYEKAAALDPENSTYLEKMGQFYITQSDYTNALDAYERLYATNKAREDILQILFQLYGSQNDYKKMIEVLDRLELLVGSNEHLSLSKMQIYDQMGDKKKEEAVLMALVAEHPLELSYKVMLGNWLFQNGKKKRALQEYKAVLREEPDNPYAQLSLLDYYRDAKDLKMVDQLTENILQSKKTEKETKMALLRQVIMDNQNESGKDSLEVLKLFDKVLASPQEDADIVLMKAAYLTLRGYPKNEINMVYEQAIEIEPDNIRARLALLQNIWEDKEYDKVIEVCRPAQEYNPEEMAFYYYQGFAQYMKHDNDGALTTFRKGVSQIKPDSNPDIVSDFYAVMGDILHEKGLDKEAFESYDSCLQWKPDNFAALNNYAYYLSEKRKDLSKAEQMSYKTIKAEPNNATYLDTYAWILFQQERYQEAKIYIDQTIKNDKAPSGVVIEHAGDIYFNAGEPEKALEYWKQASENGNNSAILKRKIEQKKYIVK